jgi:hypothetical protein
MNRFDPLGPHSAPGIEEIQIMSIRALASSSIPHPEPMSAVISAPESN